MSDEASVKMVIGERYEYVRELGSGGFGTVFLAKDLKFPDKQVAVKMLHAETPEARAELWEEIRHLSQIDDPYVLRTTDWGHHGDSIFMVTEFVKGETLTSLTDKHRASMQGPGPHGFDPLFAANVGFWIARSLIAVHAAKVVHRDLTPNNVMIDLQGSGHTATIHAVKLIDFGLASRRDATRDEARGTPHYVAPEVIRHEPVSPNTDIYSLGCILYEMVMGEPPFASNDTQWVVDQHCSSAPPPKMTSGYSEFDDLVAQMMAKDPLRRADSTARIADALSRIAAEIQRSRTVPRVISPQLPAAGPTEDTRKLPPPTAVVSTDELGVVSSHALASYIPTWRRPVTVLAAALVVILLAFIASRLTPKEERQAVQAPLAGVTPPPVPNAPVRPLEPVPTPVAAPPAPTAATRPQGPAVPLEPVAVPPPVPDDDLAPLKKAVPVKTVPAPKVADTYDCEPDLAWKKNMQGVLAALEAQANALPAVEVMRESERVGRLVNAAETKADCSKAIAEFEALKRRAIK